MALLTVLSNLAQKEDMTGCSLFYIFQLIPYNAREVFAFFAHAREGLRPAGTVASVHNTVRQH